MKKAVKFILLGLAVLALAGGGAYYLMMPLPAPLTEVRAKPAELSFTEQGVVTAESAVSVYAAAQGELTALMVEEGQAVRAGDVLCTVDDTALRLQIDQMKSGIQSYEAQLNNLRAERERSVSDLAATRDSLLGELRALEAQERGSSQSLASQNVGVEERERLQNILITQNEDDLQHAREELTKAQALYDGGVITRNELDAAQTAVTQLESGLEAARQELLVIASGAGQSDAEYYAGMKASLSARIAGIDESLEKDYTTAMAEYYTALIAADEAGIARLERDIAGCAVTAPLDGVITELYAVQTNRVSAAGPVAEITPQGEQFVEVYVSTQDVDSVRLGDAVGLTLKRRVEDVSFTGTVSFIDDTAEIKYSALGVEERKVKVKVTPDPGPSMGVGYTVDASFYLYRADAVLAVPKTAIFQDNGEDRVWVVRDGAAQSTAVTLGTELRTETVIIQGLADGDYVVTDANNGALKDGARVKQG